MSQNTSAFTSTNITESLLIAALDGDAEACELIASWRPSFKISIVSPEDPAITGPVTYAE